MVHCSLPGVEIQLQQTANYQKWSKFKKEYRLKDRQKKKKKNGINQSSNPMCTRFQEGNKSKIQATSQSS
jgi:hypothetical protein